MQSFATEFVLVLAGSGTDWDSAEAEFRTRVRHSRHSLNVSKEMQIVIEASRRYRRAANRGLLCPRMAAHP
jgi:hypothetical protein